MLKLVRGQSFGLLVGMVAALMLPPTPTFADVVQLLPTGAAALAKRIELIDGARRSIDFTAFYVDPCAASTQILVSKLKKRAAQGLRVRFLIDGYTKHPRLIQSFLHDLRQAGVQARMYHPSSYKNLGKNTRTHNKLLLADSSRYISGGRNIADEYFGVRNGQNFVDRDLFVEGRSARSAQTGFDGTWEHPRTERGLHAAWGAPLPLAEACGKKRVNPAPLARHMALHGDRHTSGHELLECRDVTYTFDNPIFTDPTGERDGSPNAEYMDDLRLRDKPTTRELLRFLGAARRSLLLENWSYIPAHRLRAIFDDLRGRNVPILAITNFVTDEYKAVAALTYHYATRHTRGSQRVLQVSPRGYVNDRWEMSPPKAYWLIHAKSFVVDGSDVAVTSFNIDPRSYHTNAESGVFVRDCRELARAMAAETKNLVEAHRRNRYCSECAKTTDFGFIDTLLGWLGHEFW